METQRYKTRSTVYSTYHLIAGNDAKIEWDGDILTISTPDLQSRIAISGDVRNILVRAVTVMAEES